MSVVSLSETDFSLNYNSIIANFSTNATVAVYFLTTLPSDLILGSI